jgi:hypothetical protein
MESECSLPCLQEGTARLNSEVVECGPQKTPKMSLGTYLYYHLAYVWVFQVISPEMPDKNFVNTTLCCVYRSFDPSAFVLL